MRTNSVKSKIMRGDIALGTFILEFNTPGIGLLAAQAGAEFTIFDMEHTGWSVETIRMLIAVTRPTEMVPIVRIPATEYHFVARVLDMGAMGIMVPMVETEEQARLLVQSAKYPPMGRRGSAFTIAHDDYSGGNIVEKIESANRETLLIAQIETAKGLKNLEAIAKVEGIDVLWVGQFDLSNSLGIVGQFDHPLFTGAIQKVLEVCKANDKVAGFLACDLKTGKEYLNKGIRIMAYGGDLWIYQAGLEEGLNALKQHLEKQEKAQ